VIDLLTDLIWPEDAGCLGTMVWSQAVAEANAFNSGQCGIVDGSVEGDWQLPDSNELRSLIDPDQDNLPLPAGRRLTASERRTYQSSSFGCGNAWDVDIARATRDTLPRSPTRAPPGRFEVDCRVFGSVPRGARRLTAMAAPRLLVVTLRREIYGT
jgi:hypothetical protein